MSRSSAFAESSRPYERVAHELFAHDESRTSALGPTTAVKSHPRLLIVDDYPDALDVWGLYLRAEGFTVLPLPTARAALDEAAREMPD